MKTNKMLKKILSKRLPKDSKIKKVVVNATTVDVYVTTNIGPVVHSIDLLSLILDLPIKRVGSQSDQADRRDEKVISYLDTIMDINQEVDSVKYHLSSKGKFIKGVCSYIEHSIDSDDYEERRCKFRISVCNMLGYIYNTDSPVTAVQLVSEYLMATNNYTHLESVTLSNGVIRCCATAYPKSQNNPDHQHVSLIDLITHVNNNRTESI